MTLDEEIYSHLLVEFKYGWSPFTIEKMVNEEHGTVPQISDIVDSLIEIAEPQIHECFNESSVISLTHSDMSKFGFKPFFTAYIFKLTISPGEEELEGGYDAFDSFLGKYDDVIVFRPMIQIGIQAKNYFKAVSLLRRILYHEIIHAYNDYMSFVKTGKRLKDNIKSYQNSIISINSGIPNEKYIGYICYLLSRFERNAYIGQLETELQGMKDEIVDSKTGMECLRKTDAYKRFTALDKKISEINGIRDEELQSFVLKIFNDVYDGKEFKTYNSLLKFLNRNWYKWKYKFINQASKIIYDVSQGREENWMIDRFNDESFEKLLNESIDKALEKYVKSN